MSVISNAFLSCPYVTISQSNRVVFDFVPLGYLFRSTEKLFTWFRYPVRWSWCVCYVEESAGSGGYTLEWPVLSPPKSHFYGWVCIIFLICALQVITVLYRAKTLWTPDDHTHMWFVPKSLPQSKLIGIPFSCCISLALKGTKLFQCDYLCAKWAPWNTACYGRT